MVDGGPVTFSFDPDRSDQLADIAYTNVVPPASITTAASDARDSDQVIELDLGEATIVDTVAYTALVPGTEYVATGELMVVPADDDTTTGETVPDETAIESTTIVAPGGDETVASSTVPLAAVIPTGVTGSVSFVPDDPDGSIDVVFAVPADSPLSGHVVVVYQQLSIASSGRIVAVHADPNAAAQTIRFAAPLPPAPTTTVAPTVPATVAPTESPGAASPGSASPPATTVAVVAANPPSTSSPPTTPPTEARLPRTGTDGSRSIASAGLALLLLGSGLLLAVGGSSKRRRASVGATGPSAT